MSSGTSFDPRIVVRPRSLDQTVDLALLYVRTCARDFIPVFGWLTAATLVVAALIAGVLQLNDNWTIATVITLAPIFERAVTVYGGRHLFGHSIRLSAAAGQALRRAPLALLFSIAANLPWLMMITGLNEAEPISVTIGILVGVFWPFGLGVHLYLREVLHLEHLPLNKSLRRARILGQYRFDRALGVLTVGFLVRISVAALLFSWVVFIAQFVLQFSRMPNAVTFWAALAGWVLAGQLLALVRLFDYVDARTRREGWDIQIRFDAIKQRDETSRARRMAA